MDQKQRQMPISYWNCLVIASFMLIYSCDSASEVSENATQPNIVLIFSDDHAWTDYGFMGHELVRTPHIDRLAASGVVFERGYVPTAVCRPSLMTMVTGLVSTSPQDYW